MMTEESTSSPAAERREPGCAPAETGARRGFGAMLREAREARGMSVRDMSIRIYLGEGHIAALEEERVADLPEPVYVRAFIRSICKLLETDPAPVLADYCARYAPDGRPAAHQIPEVAYSSEQPFDAGSSPRFGLKAAGLVIVVAAVAAGVWYALQQKPALLEGSAPVEDRSAPAAVQMQEAVPAPAPAQAPAPQSTVEPETTASDAADEPKAEGVSAPAAEPAAAAEAAAPQPPAVKVTADRGAVPQDARTGQVTLRLVTAGGQNCWVRISSLRGDATVFEQEIPGGQTREVAAQLPLRLVVGNGTALTLQADGRDVDFREHVSPRGSTARFRLL